MISRVLKIAGLMLVFMIAAGISTYLTIHLLIRSGDTVIVPELEGREVVYALEVLTELGLNTKVKGSEFNDTVPRNHIVTQDPESGTELKRGRDVRLVISKGAQKVVFPNLIGMRVPQARILLDENGLIQSTLSYIYDDTAAGERILAQFPQPGTPGMRGDSVNLLVSEGPYPVWMEMMDLKGMSLNQATVALEDSQLIAGSVRHTRSSEYPDNTVLAQSPDSGYPVLKRAAVDLTINKTQQTANLDKTTAELFRYRVPQGFLKQSVRVRISHPDANMDIYDAYVRPGTEIWLLVPKAETTTLFLYVDNELITTKHYSLQE